MSEIIIKALGKRNFLIHNFYRERAFEFATPAGRLRMVIELREIQAILCEADRLADALCMGLAKMLGITPEILEAEFREMKRKEEEG